MPNTGRIVVCPFYRDEKNKSISCEDTFHRFRYKKTKLSWMDRYCDLDWKSCPYAKELLRAYDAKDEGEEMADLIHENIAKGRELKRLSQMLTRAEKRIEAKEETIKDLRKRVRILEDKYFEKDKAYNEEQKRAERQFEETLGILQIYEARFCYLMHHYGDGTFDEEDFVKWCEGKEYRLIPKEKKGSKTVLWMADVREIKDGNNILEKSNEKEK